MGMRSVQSFTGDNFDDSIIEQNKTMMKEAHKVSAQWSSLTTFTISPHAIIRSQKNLSIYQRIRQNNDILVHTHLANKIGDGPG